MCIELKLGEILKGGSLKLGVLVEAEGFSCVQCRYDSDDERFSSEQEECEDDEQEECEDDDTWLEFGDRSAGLDDLETNMPRSF